MGCRWSTWTRPEGFVRAANIRGMNTPIRVPTIAPPAANYELAVKVPHESEMLFTAGIVGTRLDGSIAEDLDSQAEEMWKSVGEILAASGFAVEDIVSYVTYVVGGQPGTVMAARDRFFGAHRAASTLVPVPALARPEWKVEVSVVAAKTPV